MKITNQPPIQGTTSQKSGKKSTHGAFQTLLESELAALPVQGTTPEATPESGSRQTWQALQDSVALLDQAMLCLESGEQPPDQLLHDIEQLRSQVKRQSAIASDANELHQADTILAVEAARIRSLNH